MQRCPVRLAAPPYAAGPEAGVPEAGVPEAGVPEIVSMAQLRQSAGSASDVDD